MKNTVTLCVQDLVDAKKLSIRPRRVYLIILASVLAVAVLLVVLGVFNTATRDEPDYVWLLAVGLAAYFGLLYYLIVHWSARRQFKQNKRLADPLEIEVVEGGIRLKSSTGEADLKFSEFHKWKFDRKVVLLYHSDGLFQMIPTRVFASEAGRLEVIANIRRHAGNPVK